MILHYLKSKIMIMNTDYLDKTPRLVLYNIRTDSVIVFR
jgi:hypothetical protein